jgi:hypothetical protein
VRSCKPSGAIIIINIYYYYARTLLWVMRLFRYGWPPRANAHMQPAVTSHCIFHFACNVGSSTIRVAMACLSVSPPANSQDIGLAHAPCSSSSSSSRSSSISRWRRHSFWSQSVDQIVATCTLCYFATLDKHCHESIAALTSRQGAVNG